MQRTIRVRPDQLMLDPHNPRIYPGGPHSHDQKEIAKKLVDDQNLHSLIVAINHGYFRAPEPLLAMSDAGDTVVIDGNFRLLTIHIGRNPQLIKDLGINHKLPKLNTAAWNDTETVPIAIFDDQLELHAVRITRQVMPISRWERIVAARYIRRLVETGVPIEIVARWYPMPPSVARQQMEALLAFEQVKTQKDAPNLQNLHFTLWESALQQHPIRKAIGLSIEPQEPGQIPRENPIPRSKAADATQLAIYLVGDKSRRRAVESYQEISKLAAVYDDPERLQKLAERPNTSARELIEHETGRHTTVTVTATVKRIHDYATHLLAEIKQNHPEKAPENAAVQVGDTQLRLHHDGSASYAIILMSPNPLQHRHYATRLQERLKNHDPKCLVEIR